MEQTAAALLNLSANMLYLETNPPTSYSEVRLLRYHCPSGDWGGPNAKFWDLREPCGVTGTSGIKNRPYKAVAYLVLSFFMVLTKNFEGILVNVVNCRPDLTLRIWINLTFLKNNYWIWFLCALFILTLWKVKCLHLISHVGWTAIMDFTMDCGCEKSDMCVYR